MTCMADPQQDPYARLEAVRDEIDGILDDSEHEKLDPDDIRGVIFGLADGDYALARAVQDPQGEPPAPLIRMLGELLDGMSKVGGYPPMQIAAAAVQMMERSKATEQYEQRASMWREDGDDAA